MHNPDSKITDAHTLDKLWSTRWSETEIGKSVRDLKKNEHLRFLLKYIPSYGRSLEAGCGVGQYVFYLKNLGFDTVGIDISETAIQKCKEFPSSKFIDSDSFFVGDIRNTTFEENTFSFYISLGVVEHFAEGPQEALKEAYRILKPGGIAYILTPQKYNCTRLFQIRKIPKNIIKSFLTKIGYYHLKSDGWVENLWSLRELANYVKESGLVIIEAHNTGVKKSLDVVMKKNRPWLYKVISEFKPNLYPLLDNYEDGFLGKFGIHNIVVAYKPSNQIHCFHCGAKENISSLINSNYSVLFCDKCKSVLPEEVIQSYKKRQLPFFKKRIYRDSDIPVYNGQCNVCKSDSDLDELFGNNGFSIPVCKECLKNKDTLIQLRNFEVVYENIGHFEGLQA